MIYTLLNVSVCPCTHKNAVGLKCCLSLERILCHILFLSFFFPYKYITTCIKTFCPRIGCDCYCTVEFCYPAGTPVDIANGTFVLFINTWKVIFSFFQYHKEVVRLMSGEFRQKIGDKYISFARKWMNYVLTKCESGRGTRPR